MLYKKIATGQTMDVPETDASKRRILERSGWVALPEAEQPLAPAAEAPPVEVPAEQPALVDDLPEDFPEREALTAAGYGALLLVSKASDDELRAVKGVGKATLKAIRDYAISQ